jgi:hypothetical protein
MTSLVVPPGAPDHAQQLVDKMFADPDASRREVEMMYAKADALVGSGQCRGQPASAAVAFRISAAAAELRRPGPTTRRRCSMRWRVWPCASTRAPTGVGAGPRAAGNTACAPTALRPIGGGCSGGARLVGAAPAGAC